MNQEKHQGIKKQTQQNYSNLNITSQHFINYLDNLIIQLTKALSIEHNVRPDPEGKEMVRNIIQQRANFLLEDERRNEIKSIIKEVHSEIKERKINKLSLKLYNIIKIMGLE